MKTWIRLLYDLPINPRHGATKGAEFELLERTGDKARDYRYWFIGVDGTKCAALNHECELFERRSAHG